MNMSGKQITSNGPAKIAEQSPKPEPGKSTPVFKKTERMPTPAKAALNAPLHASWENHQTRNLHPYPLPSMDELKARWKQQVGAARMVWDKLSEKELLESEGHKMPLVCLIQEHHGATRDEANKQVNRFFEKHMSCPSIRQAANK